MDNLIDEEELKLEELVFISNELYERYVVCGPINEKFYHMSYDNLIDRATYLLDEIKKGGS
jgi:hypothetical protein